MASKSLDPREGKHFTVGNMGKFKNFGSSKLSTSKNSFGLKDKSFLKDEIGLKNMEVSLNRLEPGRTEIYEKC